MSWKKNKKTRSTKLQYTALHVVHCIGPKCPALKFYSKTSKFLQVIVSELGPAAAGNPHLGGGGVRGDLVKVNFTIMVMGSFEKTSYFIKKKVVLTLSKTKLLGDFQGCR